MEKTTLEAGRPESKTETDGAHALFDGVPACLHLIGGGGRLIALNRAARDALGHAKTADPVGRPWLDIWPEPERAAAATALESAGTGGRGRFVAPLSAVPGCCWEVTVASVTRGRGKARRIIASLREISKERAAIDELQANVRHLNFLLDAAQIAEWEVDPDTRLIRRSRCFDTYFGYEAPLAEWTVDSCMQQIHQDDREAVREALRRVEDGGSSRIECRVIWPDASVHWILLHAALHRPAQGTPRLAGLVADITERKRAEALATGQKEALERAVAGAPLSEVLDALTRAAEAATGETVMASVLLLDADGVHLRHGSAPSLPAAFVRAIDGLEIGPAVGSCGTAAFTSGAVVARDIATDPRWQNFREIALANGLRACWSQPIQSPDGRVLGTLAAYRDRPWEPSASDHEAMALLLHTAALVLDRHREAEERRATEQALRASEREAVRAAEQAQSERRRVDVLLQATPVGILMADASGKVVEVNRACRKIWGAPSPAQASAVDDYRQWKGWWADGSDRHGRRIKASEWPLARALAGHYAQEVVEIEPLDAPGSRRTVLHSAAPIRDAAGNVAGAVVAQMDLTERVKAEESLRRSEAHLSSLFRQSTAGIAETDVQGYFIQANDRYCEILGRSRDELIGHCMQEFTHPDDLDHSLPLFQRLTSTGEPFEIEKRYVRPDGSVVWASTTVSLIRSSDSEASVLAVVLDTTDRRRAEEELRRADRRKDEFLAMLAHELRNPLAPISAAADLLTVVSRDSNRVQQTSFIISRQVRHMTGLIDDLLDVSRVTRGLVTLEKQTLDVKSVVTDAVEQAHPLVEARGHRLSVHLSPASSFICGDRKRLVQVISNLLNNAAKYTPEGGTIVLSMEVEQAEVVIKVSDNGIGMSADLIPHVFEPFVQAERTSDRAQGGLGIGLALVRSLVELHGGTTSAISEGLGKGAEFTVRLPRMATEETHPEPKIEADDQPLPAGTVRVLVVDDNADAADMLGMYLETTGHKVAVAHHPYRAQELARKVRPDVCVLDIGLPDQDGNELARCLRRFPETEDATLIAVTGYSQQQDREAAFAAGFDHYFVKPLDMKQFDNLIADLARHRRPSQGR